MATPFLDKVIIERALALLRIDNFLDKKEIFDDYFHIDHPLADNNRYRPAQFIKLLKKIIEVADKAGGLRVYFASRDETTLTVIYAPTRKVSSEDVYEDVGKYFIMDAEGKLQSLPIEEAKLWFANYIDNFLPLLQRAGFYETNIIFYKIDIVKELLDFIQKNLPLRSTKVQFAAYLDKDDPYLSIGKANDKDFSNQLSLIFGLRGPKFGLDNNGSHRIKNMLVILGGASGDTGDPCPPPNGSCKAKGAKLYSD